MRHRLTILATVFALAAALVFTSYPLSTAAQPARDDFAIPGGWFYTQMNGRGGGGNLGFSVTNNNGIAFWDAFNAYGGVAELGFPISNRFLFKGQVAQAFQKGALQWNAPGNVVQPVNIFDELSAAGFDDWLLANKQVPKSFDWSADSGLPFPQVVARHQAILDQNAATKAAYFDSADPIDVNGLPMAFQDFGNVYTVRAQRRAFQQWQVSSPTATAGQVVVMNGGQIAAEAGLWPAAALQPAAPGGGQVPQATATPIPTATPLPPNQTCYGDERMYFSPSNPQVNQQVIVNVTSARPSANVNLTGPWGPVFNSVGQSGGLTLWTWRFTPNNTGRNDFNFTINGITCTTNFVNVSSGSPAPTPVPPPPPTPAPPGQVCGGESYTTSPARPVANQPFTIIVNAPRAGRPMSLLGPGSPGNPSLEPSPGTWHFNIGPLSPGAHEYTLQVRGTTCFRFAVVVTR